MRKKILIVDDEEDIVIIVSRVLGRNSYQAMTATNGLECLKNVDTEPPDLINKGTFNKGDRHDAILSIS